MCVCVCVCHGLYIIGWLGVSVAVGAELVRKGEKCCLQASDRNPDDQWPDGIPQDLADPARPAKWSKLITETLGLV
jgi:hypothetical protein